MATNKKTKPTLFIGSSTEALEWARALQEALTFECDPQVWTDGIFAEGATALASLLAATKTFDFAAFILTPDDEIVRRGKDGKAPRDNVILELGMFVAALGPERVLVFRPREEVLTTPSDWWGIKDCEYSVTGSNKTSSISTASKELRKRLADMGLRETDSASGSSVVPVDQASELTNDLNALTKAAESQSWVLQMWDTTVYRLVEPTGERHSFPLSEVPEKDRVRLRSDYVPELMKRGLRVSLRVQAPVGADLGTWRPVSTPQPRKRRGSSTNGASRPFKPK